MYSRERGQTDGQRGHIRTSSMSKTELSDKQTCLYRQRSLSESDADSKEQTKSSYESSANADKNVSDDKTSETKPGHKQKVSSVVKTDDYEDSTGYVRMNPCIHEKGITPTAEKTRFEPDANENENGSVTVARNFDKQQVLRWLEKNGNIRNDNIFYR